MYHYKSQGLYFDQVKAFKDNFSRVLIVLTDDLYNEPKKLVEKCYSFLDVNPDFDPQLISLNVSNKKVKNRALHLLVHNKKYYKLKMKLRDFFGEKIYNFNTKMYKKLNISRLDIVLDKDTKSTLKVFFKEDVEKLEGLLNRELSAWK